LSAGRCDSKVPGDSVEAARWRSVRADVGNTVGVPEDMLYQYLLDDTPLACGSVYGIGIASAIREAGGGKYRRVDLEDIKDGGTHAPAEDSRRE